MANFKPNRKGMRDLLRSSDVQDALMPAARQVAQHAERLAPRSDGPHSGTLAGSHKVVRGEGGQERTRVFVVADTPYAAVVAARDNWLQRAIDATAGGGPPDAVS